VEKERGKHQETELSLRGNHNILKAQKVQLYLKHFTESALQDLCLHITHFFEYYKKFDKSELIGDALRLKELYQNLLIEE